MGFFLKSKQLLGKESKSNESKSCYIELSLGNRMSNYIADMQKMKRTLGKDLSAQEKKNLQIFFISNG